MPTTVINPIDEDAVLKEVWNIEDVSAKTELSSDQIQQLNKLNTMKTIFGNELLGSHIRDFMILQKSKDRKSMAEFVAVVKAKREDAMGQGKSFFSNMMG